MPILWSKRIQEALDAGGFILKRWKKHFVYENAKGVPVIVPKTPSDHRTEENVLAEIRRASQPIAERKEDVNAIIPKTHKKKPGMKGASKTSGSGIPYFPDRPQPLITVSDNDRKELRSLLDRPLKFHSVFVQLMLKKIERYWGADLLIDASSRPKYLERLIGITVLTSDSEASGGLNLDDRFVLHHIGILLDAPADNAEEMRHQGPLGSLLAQLRRRGFNLKIEEDRRKNT